MGGAAEPKPDHLGPEFGAQFADPAVVAAYRHRPPYPDGVFEVLARLVVGPRAVLDAGCGTGAIGRGLVDLVDRVDAVDSSAAMLAAGRALPDGDHPRLRWILGTAEEAPLDPPYGLVVAASSLHWMEWAVVLPRFRAALAAGAVLALVDDRVLPAPWDADLAPVIARFSTNRGYRPYDLVEELRARGLFRPLGSRAVAPLPFAQPVAAYVESFHGRNGFSRDRMAPADAAAFDRAAGALVAPHCPDGTVRLEVAADIAWGEPALARTRGRPIPRRSPSRVRPRPRHRTRGVRPEPGANPGAARSPWGACGTRGFGGTRPARRAASARARRRRATVGERR